MYSIAIPSYNRLTEIQKYALNFITTYGLHIEAQVYVFVDPRCWDSYQILKKKFKFLELVKGKPMLTNQRNVIRDYFPTGECLVIMDDDFRGVKVSRDILDEASNQNIGKHQFVRDEIHRMFAFMKNNHLTLCGVHPTNNTYFANGTMSSGLKFAVGCFYLEINCKHPLLYHGRYCQKHNDEMEDYMRTFNHWRLAGNVGRNDLIAVNHRYNSAKGGMNTGSVAARLMNRDRISVGMAADFPTYFRVKNKKHGKSMIQEARFKQDQHLFTRHMMYKHETGAIPGAYYHPSDIWYTLDDTRNYICEYEGETMAIIIRDVIDPSKWNPELLRAISSWTKYTNTNRGDIAGVLDEGRLLPYQLRGLARRDLTLDTCKTNTARTRIAEDGFQDSNPISCVTLGEYAKGKKSQYDKEFDKNPILDESMKDILFQMENWYNRIVNDGGSAETGFLKSRFKSLTINKSLRSANHKDRRNASDYALCFAMDDPFEPNKSTGGDLLFPEFKLACNLRRNRDIVIFRSKDIWHCNSAITADDPDARYHNRISWVFFSK